MHRTLWVALWWGWVGAAQAAGLADCEGVPAALAQPAPVEARAVWLDGQRLLWPGLKLQPGERVRLLHAASASVTAPLGGTASGDDGAVVLAPVQWERGARWRFVGEGPAFEVPGDVRSLLKQQLLLVHEDAQGRVLAATGTQIPGALDALYAPAEAVTDLGATVARGETRFKLWAPTAQQVWVCRYAGAEGPAVAIQPLRFEAATGVWVGLQATDLSGHAYRYLVDVVTPTHGRVLNLVTDPYATALTVDSQRSLVADLAAPRHKPAGWDAEPRPQRVRAATDQVIYELHVRDFSISDASVRPAWRGKYLAFTEPHSRGMQHLRALAQAGLSDVHLLPVFDFASVPERACVTPTVPAGAPDGEAQQQAVMAVAARDCFNWGYDPLHFGAPEGSYAVDPLRRVREFRQMVQALHRAGLRVGMDMVYNHMSAAGQHPQSVPGARAAEIQARAGVSCGANLDASEALDGRQQRAGNDEWPRKSPQPFGLTLKQGPCVVAPLTRAASPSLASRLALPLFQGQRGPGFLPLALLDRIVPGYYHRLSANGAIERSTCCDNTATEHRMMKKLMIDTAERWVREYHIDSMRFDLMGHQPREAMEALQARVNAAAGRPVQLLGEGWNFGEVASGARFVQASQLSLNGSGIGTFSDRGRDAARGGGAGEGGNAAVANQGWLNGLFYDPNALGQAKTREDLLTAADLIRVGLAGSLRDFELITWRGERQRLDQIRYGDQPAGYVSQPAEVVNYVENHDNQTLFDVNALKLPLATSRQDRARVQMLGAALVAFSQGIAYFHAGQDILRSKSLDRNSYDSGDWFNRLDWTYRTNHFGSGLPPKQDNFGDQGRDWQLAAERLRDPAIAPTPAEIAWSRDVFRDLLRIRASTPLLRLKTAEEVKARVSFPGSGPGQNPVLIATRIDGRALPGYAAVMTLLNASPAAQRLVLPDEAAYTWRLHPVQRSGADRRVAEQATVARGVFEVPGRSAVIFVLDPIAGH